MASAKPGNEDSSHQDLGRDEKRKEKNSRENFQGRQHALQTCFVTSILGERDCKEHGWHYLR